MTQNQILASLRVFNDPSDHASEARKDNERCGLSAKEALCGCEHVAAQSALAQFLSQLLSQLHRRYLASTKDQ